MDDDTQVPTIGHNMDAGLPSVEQITTDLRLKNSEALDRVAELLRKGEEFLVIENDTQDDAATQFMVPLRARYKQSEADRVADKTPWDDRAGAVQAFYKREILDVLGLGPSKADEAFDPVTAKDYGMGPRINRAQTVYKLRKAEAERRRREAEAQAAREKEQRERAEREAAERTRRAEEDRQRAETARLAAEARRLAEAEAAAAARKRNETNKAQAEADAAAARERAAAAEAKQREEDQRIAAERTQRDEENRIAENKAAEERAAAESAASVPLADLSRARGEKGGVSSLRQFTSWRDVDRAKLDYAALGPYFKEAHIDAALKAYSDANKATVQTGIKTGVQPIRGVVFFLDAKSSGRA